MKLILASGSPRRAELLRNAGYSFEVAAPDVDETQRDGERPLEYVRRLAIEKSAAVANTAKAAGAIVLAADTTVVLDETILGKPHDDDDAREMLRRLSGRGHEVMTGVSVRDGAREAGAVAITRVEFVPMSSQEVEWYVTSGETRDKAGAYAIQGLASRFVTRVDGSYANVVGLPISLVYKLLKPFETGYSDT